MASKRQYCAHWPQPMHSPASMDAVPVSGSFAMAGHPRVAHTPQPVHFAVTSNAGLRVRSKRTHGARNTTTLRSSTRVASASAARTAFASCGSTVRTSSIPRARTTPSRSISRLSRPCRVTPLNGLPWRPVMAVVRLSRMQTVPAPLL